MLLNFHEIWCFWIELNAVPLDKQHSLFYGQDSIAWIEFNGILYINNMELNGKLLILLYCK